MSDSQQNTKNSLFWIVFLFSVSIVLISLISAIFPAILISSEPQIPGIVDTSPDPFETGVWSAPLIITNIIIFGMTFLYFKNKLPSGISKSFEKFEVLN